MSLRERGLPGSENAPREVIAVLISAPDKQPLVAVLYCATTLGTAAGKAPSRVLLANMMLVRALERRLTPQADVACPAGRS
jgi:hypothetical protein